MQSLTTEPKMLAGIPERRLGRDGKEAIVR
jgi:hypothetical protein